MPDVRPYTPVATRLDLDLNRRAIPRLWRARRYAMAWAAALALVAVAGGWAICGNSIYQARPVSEVHGLIAHRCQACHLGSFQTLVRGLSFDTSHRSVSDAACQACHPQTATDHSPALAPAQALSCAVCHREHQSAADLAQVSSTTCLACHSQLDSVANRQVHSRNIERFATAHSPAAGDHPEFFPHESVPAAQAGEVPGRAAATLVLNGTQAAWRDNGTLRFNHAKHLVAEGVRMPWPAELQATEGHSARKVLTCANCHESDEAGHSLRPIEYERHCAQCHPLEYPPPLAQGGPLPHEKPDLVKGVLRERLLAHARANPEEVTGPPGEPSPSPLPGKQPEARASREANEWAWAEAQLRDYGPRLIRSLTNGCGYCHAAAAGDSPITSDWKIEATRHHKRWFERARFSHAGHTLIQCQECHAAATSQATGDILLPSIAVCRECHGREMPVANRPVARADCIECHPYHHSALPTGQSLDRLLWRGEGAGP